MQEEYQGWDAGGRGAGREVVLGVLHVCGESLYPFPFAVFLQLLNGGCASNRAATSPSRTQRSSSGTASLSANDASVS